jgi:hypothetical protein
LEVDFLIRPHQGWAPQRNARHVRKLGAPTQRRARPQDGRPNAKLIRNENVHTREHWAKRRAGGWIRTNFGLEVDFLIRPHGTSASWAAQRTSATQRKAHPQRKRKRKARHVRKRKRKRKARPQRKRKARPHVRKLGAPTQRKARPQDGRPNAKLIRNGNVHTREH